MSGPLTAILNEVRAGVPDAADRLWAVVYDELRQIAGRAAAKDRGAVFQATEIVHEAYVKLVGGEADYQNRAHFFATAARAIRHLLIDEARARRASKRGGEREAIPLDIADVGYSPPTFDVLDIDEALTDLAKVDERQARLVELRFFGGLTSDEAAATLGISERTAAGDWAMARAWLRRRLGGSRD